MAVVHPFLYVRGGAESVVLKIAQHFNAPIYCRRYFPENTFPEFKELDVRVVKAGASGFLPNSVPFRVRDAVQAAWAFYNLKLDGFDVINAQGTPSEWVRRRNGPVVWYCHSPNREAYDLYEWRMRQRGPLGKLLYWSFIQPYKHVEANIAPKLEHVFSNSGNTQGRLKNYLGLGSEILNPAIDVEDFACGSFDKYFLYFSRFVPEKRFEYAIEAFKEFKREYPTFKLVLAGSLLRERPEHVEYFNKIKRLLGDAGEIHTDVDRKTMLKLYANCYAVLYAPKDEDFGIIPLEAMASGKPCIAVNEGVPREFVIDCVTGYLVNNAKEMAYRMSELVADQSLAERMGKAGRKRVEEKYTWDRFLSRFEEACGKVAKK